MWKSRTVPPLCNTGQAMEETPSLGSVPTKTRKLVESTGFQRQRYLPLVISPLVVEGGGDCIKALDALTATSNTKLHILRSGEGERNKEGGQSLHFEIGQGKEK
jgi:hypothetical protein